MSSADKDVEMSSTSGTLSRVSDLWWDDGNVVIKAGKKLFRVFRGILASRSPVFANMFSVPQPEKSEKIEGCPLVELPDDEDEVECFLRAIFDNSSFYFDDMSLAYKGPTCQAVVGVLRLSHKYHVPHLRRHALRHLESLLPTGRLTYQITKIRSFQFEADKLPQLLSIISVAREVGATWILPVAYYRTTRDWIPDTEVIAIFSDDLASVDNYLRGAAEQSHCYLRILKFLTYEADRPGCTTRQECSTERLRTLAQLDFWDNNGTSQFWSGPLEVWAYDAWDSFDVCDACHASAKNEHQIAMDEFWRDLPGMYGLPKWQELMVLRGETMDRLDGSE